MIHTIERGADRLVKADNKWNSEGLLLSDLKFGDYICHQLDEDAVEEYVNNEHKLLYCMGELKVSYRSGQYYLIGGFEKYEALIQLGFDNIIALVFEFDNAEKEEEIYRTLNHYMIKDTVAVIKNELSKMSEDYDFMSIVSKFTAGNSAGLIHYFMCMWQDIPNRFFYETYIYVLSYAPTSDYSFLFTPKVLDKVYANNNQFISENQDLIDKLDADGYLTIYHGHTKNTYENSNSWTLEPEIAHFFGCRNASGKMRGFQVKNDLEKYCVVTGKVKLENVIAYISDRSEEEIVVLSANVEDKNKVFYNFKENEDKYSTLEKVEDLISKRKTGN